jgi:hypothetical protein
MYIIILKLIGLGSGHAYIVLKDTWPKNGGEDVLKTPSFLYFYQFLNFLQFPARDLLISIGTILLNYHNHKIQENNLIGII